MNEQTILYANGLTLSVTAGEARLLFTVSTPNVDDEGNIQSVKVDEVADIRINNVVLEQIAKTLNEGIENFSKINNPEEVINE